MICWLRWRIEVERPLVVVASNQVSFSIIDRFPVAIGADVFRVLERIMKQILEERLLLKTSYLGLSTCDRNVRVENTAEFFVQLFIRHELRLGILRIGEQFLDLTGRQRHSGL